MVSLPHLSTSSVALGRGGSYSSVSVYYRVRNFGFNDKVRHNDIRGIMADGQEIKLGLFADDLTEL